MPFSNNFFLSNVLCICENTKIVLTGDIEQIDNLYTNETSNGLAFAVEKFKVHDMCCADTTNPCKGCNKHIFKPKAGHHYNIVLRNYGNNTCD